METGESNKVYELGFHLVPTLSGDAVAARFSALKDMLTEGGAKLISEESPKEIALAYRMEKPIAGKLQKFDRAYFGWVKFETSPEHVASLKSTLPHEADMVRYLLIKTVKEDTMAPKKLLAGIREVTTKVETRKPVEVEVKVPVSEAELDKAVEALVGEKT